MILTAFCFYNIYINTWLRHSDCVRQKKKIKANTFINAGRNVGKDVQEQQGKQQGKQTGKQQTVAAVKYDMHSINVRKHVQSFLRQYAGIIYVFLISIHTLPHSIYDN